MCGIFGYIGKRNPLQVCLKGLELLEYRGYDSTGIAGIHQGALAAYKRAGDLALLKEKLNLPRLELAIAHTRWATHGKVSDENAHPQFDETQSLALIHNGIIENFDVLRSELQKAGARFRSDTDTEVVAHLLNKHYRGNLLEALLQTLPLLKGAFALIAIHKDHPDQMIAAAKECPLAIAIDEARSESILSSDPNTFSSSSPLDVLFLERGEAALVQRGRVDVFSLHGERIVKKTERLEAVNSAPSKEGFAHYMLKEIYEQPAILRKTFLGRFREKEVELEELFTSPLSLEQFHRAWILGCGTSAHAGSIGALFLEDLARLPAQCEIASEARFRPLLLSKETLIIALSQSGETADTLAAVREAAPHRPNVLSICNVKNSSLVRASDATLFLGAGPEISVCSTKTFTSHLALLFLFTLYLGRKRGTLSQERAEMLFHELQQIPSHIEQILARTKEIELLAKKYASYDNFFFMGRRYLFPTCLEAALKLKEISYLNANGYPAGELKHGPIALLHRQFPVISFCANEETHEKMVSNLMEVKARGAPTLAFASSSYRALESIVDDLFWLPPTLDPLAPFSSAVAGQLFAYYIALARGRKIDQPQNLAKTVTVE